MEVTRLYVYNPLELAGATHRLLTGRAQIRFSRLDEDSLSSIKEMMIPQIDETHE